MEENKLNSLSKKIGKIHNLLLNITSNTDEKVKNHSDRLFVLESQNSVLSDMVKLLMVAGTKQSEIMDGLVKQQDLLMAEIQRKR